MKSRSLLDNLLRSLLGEWSRELLIETLNRIADEEDTSDESVNMMLRRTKKHPHTKPSAYELAAKTEAPQELKVLIIDLAKRYDNKEFLPNIGDVRYFLQMRGKDASNIKQRPEAFRRVLNSLLEITDEHLHQIVDQKLYSGPSDLRPLAEAIRQTGRDLRGKQDYE